MARKIPTDYGSNAYGFTLVATGGNRGLFIDCIPCDLLPFGETHIVPIAATVFRFLDDSKGRAMVYMEEGGSPRYVTPPFLLARDTPDLLEFDIYRRPADPNSIGFASSLGFLTTPLLRAGYALSIENRIDEILKAEKECKGRKLKF